MPPGRPPIAVFTPYIPPTTEKSASSCPAKTSTASRATRQLETNFEMSIDAPILTMTIIITAAGSSPRPELSSRSPGSTPAQQQSI